MKKWLLVLMLLAGLAVLSQIDDTLDPQAVQLISRLEADVQSPAFLYLYGIFAAEGEDPAQLGATLFARYQGSVADESVAVADYAADKLALPEGDAFCRISEPECLRYLFSSEVDAKQLATDNNTLLSRAEQFFSFAEYSTMSKPSVDEVLPVFRYLTTAYRIRLLQAIAVYHDGHANAASELLLDQINRVRASMALQDSLIGKLVFLSLLAESLDVLSIIVAQENLPVALIPALSPQEKSFARIAVREFAMSYYLFSGLDRNPQFFDLKRQVPGWFTRLVYKPNMTINASTPRYVRLEQLALLPADEFARQLAMPGAEVSTSYIRNYAGAALLGIGDDFDAYVGRLFDVDAKLALFNQLHHFKLAPQHMQNPYFGTEMPTIKDGQWCFSGPQPAYATLRCLSVTLQR